MEKAIFPDGKLNGELVGKDAAYILAQAGVRVDEKIRLAIMETGSTHPLVDTEQLMPVLPFVRVRDFDAGLQLALESEHGDKHTAVIHTKDMTRVDPFCKKARCDSFSCQCSVRGSLGCRRRRPVRPHLSWTHW